MTVLFLLFLQKKKKKRERDENNLKIMGPRYSSSHPDLGTLEYLVAQF
jgi:hypothetical protein